MALLQQFVTSVQKLSNEGHLSQMADVCRKAITEVLMRNTANLDNVLPTFDLQRHSLGVLAVLYVKLQHVDRRDFDLVFAQLQEFFSGCNGEQIRMLPDVYSELCHRLTELLTSYNESARGIPLLKEAIVRLRSSASQLTPVHADLCQLCLHSKLLKPALPFLNTDITDILKESNQGSDSRYFLSYYLYGGMIYATLKNFERAYFFFEVAVTTPCNAVSHIMLEAYKKYVLVSLLLRGKAPSPPKYTSSVVNRFIKPLCQPYHELATAYGTNNPDKLIQVVNQHEPIFTTDKNMGLVKQVVSCLYKRSIQCLTKTFLTLSLADVASRCHLQGPEEAESHILNMIDDGEIYASINQKDGMVYFKDNPEKYASLETLAKLDEQLKECMAQEKLVKNMDERIMLSADYQRRANKSGSGLPDDEGLGLVIP